MKHDYFWARQMVLITGIILLTQLIFEIIGTRKPEFWWVLPVCAIAWVLSLFYAMLLIVLNARKVRND